MSNCCNNNSKEKIIKHDCKDLEGLICYCFKYSKKELYDAIKSGNEYLIIEDIKAKIKEQGCFCDTANPSGKCCLSDIRNFIEAAKDTK